MELVKIGVPGFDEVFKGGIIKNSAILVKGAPGSGKTIFSLQFIYEGAKMGQAGLFITVEEDLDIIRSYSKAMGMDLEKYEKKKLIFLVKQPVTLKRLVSIAVPYNLMKKRNIKRVVVDSLSLFRYMSEDEIAYRKEILNLLEDMNNVLFVATAEEKKEGVDNVDFTAEDYLFDSLIRMVKIRKGNTFERCAYVSKSRGQDHLTGIFPFNIQKGGLILYPKEIPFSLIEKDFMGKK